MRAPTPQEQHAAMWVATYANALAQQHHAHAYRTGPRRGQQIAEFRACLASGNSAARCRCAGQRSDNTEQPVSEFESSVDSDHPTNTYRSTP